MWGKRYPHEERECSTGKVVTVPIIIPDANERPLVFEFVRVEVFELESIDPKCHNLALEFGEIIRELQSLFC